METATRTTLSHPQNTPALPSRLRQIDALQLLRAIAVILVIWFHSGLVLNFTGSHELPSLGVFGIDLFFVISGFILSLAVLKQRTPPGLRPMRDFMLRRFLRIYPIYWVLCIATLTRLALARHLFDHNWLAAFFLLPSFHYPGQDFVIDFSWTMNFEIFFYFLLGLILFKTIRHAVPVLILLLLASTITGAIFGIRHAVVILIANPILLEFVFGAILALLYVRFGRRRFAGIILTTIGIATTLFIAAQNLPSVANGEQMILIDNGPFARIATWGICAALIVAGTIFWSPSMKSPLGKFFVALGNASYSTYLASAFFLEFSSRLFFKLHSPPLLTLPSRLFFQTATTLSVLAAGLAVYTFIEKPLLRSLQNKFLKQPTSPNPALTPPTPTVATPPSPSPPTATPHPLHATSPETSCTPPLPAPSSPA